jgi:CRP-like cAMP-binding protein
VLGAALLTIGAWLLRRARRERSRLPDVERALSGGTVEEREVAACSFVLEGLYLGVRDVFGRGTAAAVARMMEAEQKIRIEDGVIRDTAEGETPRERAWRYRFAVADLFRLTGDRVGDQFCEYLLGHVVARLPATAHETIAASGPSTLPVLGAVLEADTGRRLQLLRQAVPFTDFDLHSLRALGDLLGMREYDAGEVIIVQGDVGDCFYMLARGTARVYLEDSSGDERSIATLRPGDAFGEAALLRHEPRSASVVADEPCLVLTLHRTVFANFMQSHKELLQGVFARQEDLRLLREVPLFASLTGVQITVLCRRLRAMEVAPGEAVIQVGEMGDRFYLIREGSVEVRVPQEGEGEMKTVAHLTRGEYFGEIALLNDTARTATVVASRRTELLALERDDFHALLGGHTGERLARRSLERMKELQASSATPRRKLEESSD